MHVIARQKELAQERVRANSFHFVIKGEFSVKMLLSDAGTCAIINGIISYAHVIYFPDLFPPRLVSYHPVYNVIIVYLIAFVSHVL